MSRGEGERGVLEGRTRGQGGWIWGVGAEWRKGRHGPAGWELWAASQFRSYAESNREL